MFFDFGNLIFEQFTILSYVGKQLIQTQTLSCPPEIAQAQFMQAMQTIAEQKGRQVMTVEMRRPADCPAGYHYIRFSNYDDEGVFET